MTATENEDFFGKKTCFMRLQFDDGAIENVKNFAWLDRNELVDRVGQQRGEDESKFYRYLL